MVERVSSLYSVLLLSMASTPFSRQIPGLRDTTKRKRKHAADVEGEQDTAVNLMLTQRKARQDVRPAGAQRQVRIQLHHRFFLTL